MVSGDVSQPGLGIDPKVARAHSARRSTWSCTARARSTSTRSSSDGARQQRRRHAPRGRVRSRSARDASFVQVSTCFVAGNREGRILEQVDAQLRAHARGLRRRGRVSPTCKQLVARHPRGDRRAPRRSTKLRAELVESVIEQGPRPEQPPAHRAHPAPRVEGAARPTGWCRRARSARPHWGWPNLYTFTKSMAESMLLARFPELDKTFFRPAIIESAVSFPLPGWNEGLNTSGPLVYFMGTWFRHMPAAQRQAARRRAGRLLLRRADRGLGGAARRAAPSPCTSARPATAIRSRWAAVSSSPRSRTASTSASTAKTRIERVVLSRWDAKVVDDRSLHATSTTCARWPRPCRTSPRTRPRAGPSSLRKELKKLGRKSDRARPQAA